MDPETMEYSGMTPREVAEAQVLGALVWRKGEGLDALNFTTEDFCSPAHRGIFKAINELHANECLVDESSIIPLAGCKASEVFQVVNSVCTGQNLFYYADRLYKILVKQKSAKVKEQLANSIRQEGDPREAAARASREIEELQETYFPRGKGSEFEDVTNQVFKSLRAGEEIQILHTGLGWFDEMTQGLAQGDQIILAARPSVGKTDLALQIMTSLAKRKIRSCFISIEMTGQVLLFRILAGILGEDVNAVFRRRPPDALMKQRIIGAEPQAREIVRYIDLFTQRVNSMRGVEAAIRKSAENGAQIMLLDYLQLMDESGRSRNEEIEKISRGLKLLNKELKISSIILSQLARGAEKEKREPRLSDLRDSGSIEQDADAVMFLHRCPKTNATFAILAKGRNVGRGFRRLHHTGATHQFYEEERSQS